MRFVSIHHHSTFSYLDGYGTPKQHSERMAELGSKKLFLTEHGNVSSHVQHEQAAHAAGIDAGFGCELYCGGVGEAAVRRKNHLTVLAENQEGYRNLLRVVSRGWSEGFYYEPTVSGTMLHDHREGLVVLSGCSGSLLSTSIVGGKNVAPEDASIDRGRAVANRFKESLGDAYYLEVQVFPELEKTCAINQALAQLSEELNIPLVATLDAHYMRPEESELQTILHAVRPGKLRSFEDVERSWGYHVKLCSPLTDKAIWQRLVATGLTPKQAEQAILNTEVIAQRCQVTLPKIDILRYPLPVGYDDPVVLFRKWMNDGWQYRNINSKPMVRDYMDRGYLERAKYEAELIEEKGFVDYFLLVSDAVRFAKDSGIPVGPARGSAAASLVCYLLRITEINPMLFPTLLFERFIDINRHDLPDIDLDFDDERRHEVRDYLVAKYGADRVGNIGTFVKYKGKNSLDDVARVFNVPAYEVKQVKDLMIERASGDLRASSTIEDTIEMFPQVKDIFDRWPDLYKATLLEGNVKGMSVHAAGLVIANGPLTEACAVYCKTDKRTGLPLIDPETGEAAEVVSVDKYDAEYLNVLKLDALGLATMAAIRIALEQIDMRLEELYELPLEDQESIRGFKEGDVVGIFQFDGRAMRSVNSGVLPDNFMEVCDINALARPGPLHSGATAEYIDVKHGRKEAIHWHPIVDRITRHTNYQVVYQEQILQTVRDLGDFSWEEAARIRKIISKKRGEQEFNRQRDKFVQGAIGHGMDADGGHAVFNMLATAGAYAFNAAHCISYGLLAHWTMWLKRHHPQAFYLGALRKCKDDKKGKVRRGQLLRDADQHSVPIGQLHMNRSGRSWSIDGTMIRPGFTQVSGIGDKIADKLLEVRETKGGFSGWKDIKVKGIGPAKLGYMQDFISDSDPFELNYLRDNIAKVKKAIANGDLMDGPFPLPTPTFTSAEVPYDRADNDTEVVWLGVIRDRNLKDLFEVHYSKTGEQLDPNTVKRPDLNEWVVMLGEDETDPLTITVDRWSYPNWREQVWEIEPNHDMVLVRGLKKGFQSRRAIYVTRLWVIDPMAEETDEDDEEIEDGS